MGQQSRHSYDSGLKALAKRHGRPLAASLACVVVATVIIGLATAGSTAQTPVASSEDLATWQKWGMSIQRPPGVPAHYSGFAEPNATSDSGLVQWVWNGTSLTLTWATAAQSEIHPGLPSAEEIRQGTGMTNVVLGDGGNTNMDGAVWTYQTYTGTMHGEMSYAAVASSYYSTSHRVYILVLVDSKPATLATLESYGSTFHG